MCGDTVNQELRSGEALFEFEIAAGILLLIEVVECLLLLFIVNCVHE